MPLFGVAEGEGEAEDPVAGVMEGEPRDGDGVAVWSAEVGAGMALGCGGVDVVDDPQAPATSTTVRAPIAQLALGRFIS